MKSVLLIVWPQRTEGDVVWTSDAAAAASDLVIPHCESPPPPGLVASLLLMIFLKLSCLSNSSIPTWHVVSDLNIKLWIVDPFLDLSAGTLYLHLFIYHPSILYCLLLFWVSYRGLFVLDRQTSLAPHAMIFIWLSNSSANKWKHMFGLVYRRALCDCTGPRYAQNKSLN